VKAHAKKVAVGIVGGLVLLAGIALLVLPGPAFIVIPAGLAILATEFEWAQRWKDRVKKKYQEMRDEHRKKKQQRAHAT
jgi:tellurite resistance protein TerC